MDVFNGLNDNEDVGSLLISHEIINFTEISLSCMPLGLPCTLLNFKDSRSDSTYKMPVTSPYWMQIKVKIPCTQETMLLTKVFIFNFGLLLGYLPIHVVIL